MVVKIEIKGVNNAVSHLKTKNRMIFSNVSKGIGKAGDFLEGEIVQSINGRRSEPKSFDTGNFSRSIGNIQIAPLIAIVGDIRYPVPYAKHLEFGTSRMNARKHFRNSASRNKNKIIQIIESRMRRK